MTNLEKLKTRLGVSLLDTTKDDLLNLLLEDAAASIMDFCNRELLPSTMEPLQRDLAIVYYNRMGTEGESSRSEGGVSVSYETAIPDQIQKRLKAFRLLKLTGVANSET